MPVPTFLFHRAHSLVRIAQAYEKLENLCNDLGLTPLSGDTQTKEQWANNVNHFPGASVWGEEGFLPCQENGILLTYTVELGESKRQFVIVALHVNTDGSYYGTSEIGGNHDWDIGELKHACSVVIKRLPKELAR